MEGTGSCPVVGGAGSWPLVNRALLRKSLSCLSAVGVALFLPCWLFGLRCPSTEAYRLLGGASGGLREGSHQ